MGLFEKHKLFSIWQAGLFNHLFTDLHVIRNYKYIFNILLDWGWNLGQQPPKQVQKTYALTLYF